MSDIPVAGVHKMNNITVSIQGTCELCKEFIQALETISLGEIKTAESNNTLGILFGFKIGLAHKKFKDHLCRAVLERN